MPKQGADALLLQRASLEILPVVDFGKETGLSRSVTVLTVGIKCFIDKIMRLVLCVLFRQNVGLYP